MAKQQNMRTPRWFFDRLQKEILINGAKFELDAFASQYNRLCEAFCSESYSGLTAPWFNATYGNPRFTIMGQAVRKAYREMIEGIQSVLVGPPPCSQAWAHDCVIEKGGVKTYFPDGRIQFKNPDGTPTENNRVDVAVYHFTTRIYDRGFTALPFSIPSTEEQVKLVLAEQQL